MTSLSSSSSSSASPPPRSQRGRVATLGIAANVAIDRFLVHPALKCESLFDLLGAMTAATTQQPINAVLLDPVVFAANHSNEADAAAVRAIRRVDPAVRIVLLTDEQQPVETSIAHQVDDVLLFPLTVEGVSEAFDGAVSVRAEPLPDEPPTPRPVETLDRPSDSAPVATTSPSIPDDLVSVSADDLPAPADALRGSRSTKQPVHARKDNPDDATARDATSETHVQRPADAPQPPSTQEQRVAAAHAATSATSHPRSKTTRLGDVDLVACVMHGDGSLPIAAADLIGQQTGWEDVFICYEEPTVGTFEAINHDAQTIGWLRCDDAERTQLRKWADWIAPWLVLDREHRRYRQLTYVDDLTGAWNRRYFMRYMKQTIAQARQQRIPISIMVFDLDNFKQFNDQHGHHAGDEILVETVRLLQSVIRNCDKVCRIGGDEFVVIFADLSGPREDGSDHPATVESMARRFQDQVAQLRFPKLSVDAPGHLTISAGLANFPWDGSEPAVLLELADQRALESKRAGKNLITFGGN